MNIQIKLDTDSINNAIRQLVNKRDEIEHNTEELVDILATEGAEVAQSAYGNWGVEALALVAGGKGSIFVHGDMPLIAEFGAGDATENPGDYFEDLPYTPVTPGSYSLLEGSREYWDSHLAGQGRWHFAGQEYTEVPPHLGLYQAKQFIIANSTSYAQGVFTS